MDIREIKNKNKWEDFLWSMKEKTFLHSWGWGEFQKSMGQKIWRLGLFEKEKLLMVSLVIKIKAKRGKFLFIPHGPIIEDQNPNFKFQVLKLLKDKLKKIAKEEKCIFIRIAPIWKRTEANREIFRKLEFKKAPFHTHPELSWELDLEKSKEELLMGMRKNTRNLIRRGLRTEGLTVEKSENIEDIKTFNNLYQETVNRHHFVPFSLLYLKEEFRVFSSDNQALLFLAKYKGEYITSAIIIFWQGRAFYHQGASSLKNKNIPAAQLMQWEIIKEAKERGMKKYNFWGIADIEGKKNPKKHPFWGLSLFKKGFGGEEKTYLKTQDLPLSPFYFLTSLFEKIRKKKRGF